MAELPLEGGPVDGGALGATAVVALSGSQAPQAPQPMTDLRGPKQLSKSLLKDDHAVPSFQ